MTMLLVARSAFLPALSVAATGLDLGSLAFAGRWRIVLADAFVRSRRRLSPLFGSASRRPRMSLRRWLRPVLPRMGDTERIALEAGTVWWDGELFSGQPDWRKLFDFRPQPLSDASGHSSTVRSTSSAA